LATTTSSRKPYSHSSNAKILAKVLVGKGIYPDPSDVSILAYASFVWYPVDQTEAQEANMSVPKMAKDCIVPLLPVDTELTMQQAAELLRVSRPSLIKMLDEKELPYRGGGAHRRIRYEDVLLYLNAELARRAKVMEELVAETERLGLYR
jgi:excisionase family DNA binding protein